MDTNINDNENIILEDVLGIDLGTRYSCISVWRNNRFEIIPDNFGNRTIPSIVSFYKSAKLVGNNALALKEVNPENTIYDIKRIIGRRIGDETLEQTRKLLTYQLTDDQSKHQNVMVRLNNTDGTISHKLTYRPEEICAQILIEIKKLACNYLKKPVSKCVITVPAYFNDAQRQATLDAARIASLDVIKMINEPTAAALAYGMGNKSWGKKSGGNVIIYDFGAGTLDVSLMNIDNGSFRTLAVGGNTHLGGEDIDYLLMNHILIEFKRENKIKDLSLTKLAQLKLKQSVETAKKILSSNDKAVVCVDNFWNGKKLYYVVTLEQFNTICNELFVMCMKPLRDVLESASMTKNNIDDVILVGGSTRVPRIQKMILDFFKNTRVKNLVMSLSPDEVVSTGAAIYGYIMTHNEDPFSSNLVLLDIIPLTLGVQTLKKQMTNIIPRNSTIPTRKTKVFTTDTDDQDTVTIKIFEGERKLTKYNYHVGTFQLTGFEKGPRGYPIIRITFHVDINGILNVTAHEKRSNVKNSMEITSTWGAKGRLSKDEIEQMIAEAKKNECLDNMYSLKVGFMHNIKSLCEMVLCNLKHDQCILSNTDVKKIKKDLSRVLRWLQKKDFSEFTVDELKKKYKELTNKYTPLMIQLPKTKSEVKESISNDYTGADVYGDDEETEECQIIKISDPLDYEQEEIKSIKKTISDMCQNIISVVNNPVSNIDEIDREFFVDYIDSVRIWIITTPAKSVIEFVAKIKEINDFTEELMNKYIEKPAFQDSTQFSKMDELQLTCDTLSSCIKSNFFSLGKDQTEKLMNKITETNAWIANCHNEKTPNDTPNEALNEKITEKIFEINELCNNIYSEDTMKKLKIEVLDNDFDSDTDSDSESETDSELDPNTTSVKKSNAINENIQAIIDSMPKKISREHRSGQSINANDSADPSAKSEVLLKIDLAKLSPTKLTYKK